MVKTAKESIKRKASTSEIYGQMQAVFIEIDKSPVVSLCTLICWIMKITQLLLLSENDV